MIYSITTLGWELVQFVRKICLQGWYTFETYRWNPRLDARASPVAANQTNRHLDLTLQVTREVVADRGEVGYNLRSAGLPSSRRHIAFRLSTGPMRNLDVTDEGVISISNLFFRISRTAHCPFHIGLTGAEPDLAYQHIL